MKKGWIALIVVLGLIVIGYFWFSGKFNSMVQMEEDTSKQWANVETSYQRRADLIPNLVNTVKGAADFEREVLTNVIEARSKATSIQVNANELNPESIARFQEAQSQLSGALSRLLVTIERYPELKANQNFLQLQNQLEGTENRISVERRKFNEVVGTYNAYIKKFPNLIIANFTGFEEKGYFAASEGADTPPTVEF